MLEMKFSAAEQLKLELGPPNHCPRFRGRSALNKFPIQGSLSLSYGIEG